MSKTPLKSSVKPIKPPGKLPGKPSALTIGFLMLWHGAFSGGFFVAMLTGEGAYDAHVFAGIVTIFAIGFRVLVGAAFPKGHALSFPWPSFSSLTQGTHGFRRFIAHTMGGAMLLACGLAALTGWFSYNDADAHGAISYMALSLIGAHVVLVILMQGWKKAESFVRAKP